MINYNDKENPNQMLVKAFIIPIGVTIITLVAMFCVEAISESFAAILFFIGLLITSGFAVMYWVAAWRVLTYKNRSHWWYISMLGGGLVGLIVITLLGNKSDDPNCDAH